MANDKTLGSRIPFEDIQSFSSWQPPTLGTGARVVPSVKKKDEKKAERRAVPGEQIVEDLPDHPATPMTAQQLRELTETVAQEAREEGFAQGYEDGMKQGEKKGAQLGEQKAFRETRERLTARTQAFEALADALFKPVNEHEAELENTLITMAVELARHFIHSELSINPSLMFATVEQAVASLPAGARDIQVWVNPDDLVHVEEAFVNKRDVWKFVADAQISRGGCRVDSASSSVDFTFDKRIQTWRDSLTATADAPPPDTDVIDYRPSGTAPGEESSPGDQPGSSSDPLSTPPDPGPEDPEQQDNDLL